MNRFFAALTRNAISLVGTAIATAGAVLTLTLFLIESIGDHHGPYVGILTYLILPGVFVFGLVLIPIGDIRARRRARRAAERGEPEARFPVFDLNRETMRRNLFIFLVLSSVNVVIIATATYKGVEVMDSTEFCGATCHTVMQPEYTAYQHSPHSRVKCVACHIGPGAGWFVKSKLSGAWQLVAVTFDLYPRPIPTPVHALRPARETCEECHWRRKFTGYKENVRSYFLSDEQNTRHDLRMLVKIGGEKTAFMKGSGIHYHMMIARSIEYVAVDERRQGIAWVRVTRADGSVTEYRNEDYELDDSELNSREVRKMDCMDCHNRPAHQFPSPVESVNQALAEERLAADLPYIKVEAVRALDDGYASSSDAMVKIANKIRGFYGREYPEVIRKRSDDLTRAIQEVQSIYSNSIFPGMKAKWSAYPNNIGHVESPGCFRCHTDSMISEDGDSIFHSCNECHLILAQGDSIQRVNVDLETGLDFIHPDDYETMDEFEDCADCHTGGMDVYE